MAMIIYCRADSAEPRVRYASANGRWWKNVLRREEWRSDLMHLSGRWSVIEKKALPAWVHRLRSRLGGWKWRRR